MLDTTTAPALRAGLLRKEVADTIGVSIRTPINWSHRGYGPTPVLDGNRMLYDPAEVTAFIAIHGAGK